MKGEGTMETYTTGQVIDILKPGQEARCTNNKYTQNIIKCTDDAIQYVETCYFVALDTDTMKLEWQLLPQYVTFEEVKQAYEEGKRIRCDYTVDGVAESETYFWRCGLEVSWEEILNGKWSIIRE